MVCVHVYMYIYIYIYIYTYIANYPDLKERYIVYNDIGLYRLEVWRIRKRYLVTFPVKQSLLLYERTAHTQMCEEQERKKRQHRLNTEQALPSESASEG